MEGSLQRRRRRRTAGGSARLVCISPRPPLFLPSDVAFFSFSPFSPSLFLVRCPHLTKVFLKSTREGAASIFCSPFPPPRIRAKPKSFGKLHQSSFLPFGGRLYQATLRSSGGKEGRGEVGGKVASSSSVSARQGGAAPGRVRRFRWCQELGEDDPSPLCLFYPVHFPFAPPQRNVYEKEPQERKKFGEVGPFRPPHMCGEHSQKTGDFSSDQARLLPCFMKHNLSYMCKSFCCKRDSPLHVL